MSVVFTVLPARPQAPLHGAAFHHWYESPGDDVWCEFRRVPNGIHLRFPGLADFSISDEGREVRAIPIPGLDDATLEHIQLNQVLPLALSAQGIPVFHGSAVQLDGHSVAFIGVSGRGKSTLATYLALQGAPLLTDDGIVLERVGVDYLIQPSEPSVRLWQDSQEALVGTRLPVAPSVSYTVKARFLANDLLTQCVKPTRLRRAYFLGDGSSQEVVITPLTAAEAAVEWIKHSFLLDVGDKERLILHFDQVSQLASLNLSFRLDYPRDYGVLDQVRAALRADQAG